jgi:lysozyme
VTAPSEPPDDGADHPAAPTPPVASLTSTLSGRSLALIAAVAVIALAGAGFVVIRSRLRLAERSTCQPGPTVPGIDVSYYQQTIDWPRVQRAGIRFAFVRLSDGATQRDPMFAANWTGAHRAGLVRGAYQYFRPDQDIAIQADMMIAAMQADRGDLPPALDIETEAAVGLTADQLAERAAAWVAQVKSRLGVEPIIYTGSDPWRTGGADPLATQPLWIAHYRQGCPVLPEPWTRWVFWQHTNHGGVPGIEGSVDLDSFSGTLAQLHGLH